MFPARYGDPAGSFHVAKSNLLGADPVFPWQQAWKSHWMPGHMGTGNRVGTKTGSHSAASEGVEPRVDLKKEENLETKELHDGTKTKADSRRL